MANRWNFIRRILGSKEKQLDTQFAQFDNRFRTLLKGPEHEILKLLHNTRVEGTSPLPREWVKLSQMLYDKVTICRRAIDERARFVGPPVLEDALEISERLREEANAYIETAQILIEKQPYFSDSKGLALFTKTLVRSFLLYGSAFIEDRFDTDEEGEIIMDEGALGILLFDSDHFDYEPHPVIQSYVLRYLDDQYPQVDPNTGQRIDNRYFQAVKVDISEKHPWGIPTLAGNEMLAKIFISLLVCIELQALRFGNPPTMTLIGQADPDFFRGQGTAPDEQRMRSGKQETVEAMWHRLVQELRESINEAWAAVHKGKAADIVSALPGDLNYHSKVLGEGFDKFIDPDMLWKMTILFVNGLKIPPVLLNIIEGGGGINSEMFSVNLQMFRAGTEDIRKAIRPVIEQCIHNHLLSLGFSPVEVQRVKIRFEDIDLMNELERAEAALKKAEATGKQLENLEMLSLHGDDSVREYAEQVGIKTDR